MHLMLLFIRDPAYTNTGDFVFKYISCYCLSLAILPRCGFTILFKYISCYCLSDLLRQDLSVIIHSNTSHVIVYLFHLLWKSDINTYSNTSHVIVYPTHHRRKNYFLAFKYISCYCLSGIHMRPLRLFGIQIHLMLLFIKDCGKNHGRQKKFKYISCYCLSGARPILPGPGSAIQIHLMLLFINPACKRFEVASTFKYISCYCLSDHFRRERLPLSVFKYISCYCLSVIGSLLTACIAYSNTSHVIVYPSRRRGSVSGVLDSNTSHVIVYPDPPETPAQISGIQIHLMLLFIRSLCLARFSLFHIQIHLMLLFIVVDHVKTHVSRNSNTSHVIVYLIMFRTIWSGT